MSWLDKAKAEAEVRLREQQRAAMEAQRTQQQAEAEQQAAELRLQELCRPLVEVVRRTVEPLLREGIEADGPKREDIHIGWLRSAGDIKWEREYDFQEWRGRRFEEDLVNIRRMRCYYCLIKFEPHQRVHVIVAVPKGRRPVMYVTTGGGSSEGMLCGTEVELQESLKPYLVDHLTQRRSCPPNASAA